MKFTIYIHSEILHSPFDLLTTKFWGAQPHLIKKCGGGLKPPLPPRFSASVNTPMINIEIKSCNLLNSSPRHCFALTKAPLKVKFGTI